MVAEKVCDFSNNLRYRLYLLLQTLMDRRCAMGNFIMVWGLMPLLMNGRASSCQIDTALSLSAPPALAEIGRAFYQKFATNNPPHQIVDSS